MNDKNILKYYVSEFSYIESSEEINSIDLAVNRRVKAYTQCENLNECKQFLLINETLISNKDNPEDSFNIKLVVKFECSCTENELSKELITKEYCPYIESLSNRILKDLTTDMKISPLDLMN